VVAGQDGLDNVIRHVSVIEVPDAVRWFQGYELMITAGYSYRHSEHALVQLVEDLVCADAAALAICYSERYLGSIPECVAARANELKFPLLELPLDVKYIEIITPVMGAVINRQAQYLDSALRAHIELEHMVLKSAGPEAMVRRVAELLDVPVLLLTPSFQLRHFSSPHAADPLAGEVATDWRSALEEARPDAELGSAVLVGETNGERFAALPLGTETILLGYVLALGIAPLNAKQLLLSQCSMPLTVELLLERTRQDAVVRLQRDFFDDLFDGEMSDEVATRRANAYGMNLDGCSWVVVADIDALASQFLKAGQEQGIQKLKDGLKRLASALVDTEAEGGVVVSRSDSVVLLPRFTGVRRAEVLNRARCLAQRLCEEAASRLAPTTVSVGVSAFCRDLSQLPHGFRTAQAAIDIGRRIRGPRSVHCWDEMGAYQLLHAMKGSDEARAFVARNLDPLLNLPWARAEPLVSTLETVLACRGNIEQAATRLHIHRNTVRYRLERIRRLLGRDPLEHTLETEPALALRKLV